MGRVLKYVYAAVLMFLFNQCNRIKPPAPERTQLDSTLLVPVSELSVPIFYPIQDIEDLANEKLGAKIIEAGVAISDKNDSLFLSIAKFKPIRITYDGDRGLTYQLPIQIDGNFKSKVMGIKVQNKQPIHAKIIITMFSELYLDKDWHLKPKTILKNIAWIEEPKLNIAGINWNLRPPIEKVIESNQDSIVAKIDASVEGLVKMRQTISKLWGDIQKPIRINRKIKAVWLKFDAEDINGRLVPRSKDTLMIEVGLRTRMRTILDSAANALPPKPLPSFKRKESIDPGLNAYALATLPFDDLNRFISSVTDTMKFQYGNRTVRIKSSEVYGTYDGIAIRITLAGNVNADLFMKGKIGFDTLEKKLMIQDFGFDVNSEESLVNAADWFGHDEIIERIEPYLSLPLDKAFDFIPALILKGVEKGKLGSKIDIYFSKFDLNVYQQLITRDNIQIILSVDGEATIRLQEGLFDKKKKPA